MKSWLFRIDGLAVRIETSSGRSKKAKPTRHQRCNTIFLTHM